MIPRDSLCPALKEANAESPGEFSVEKRSPLRLRLAVTSYRNSQAALGKGQLPGMTFVPKDK